MRRVEGDVPHNISFHPILSATPRVRGELLLERFDILGPVVGLQDGFGQLLRDVRASSASAEGSRSPIVAANRR
jgi:hypothetical protein